VRELMPKVCVETRVYELPVLLALLEELERLLPWQLGADPSDRCVEELWRVLREECVEGREMCDGVWWLYGTRAMVD
jgi:hypothetical protein